MKTGWTNTHMRDIEGAYMLEDIIQKTAITVRFTSDGLGETLSLSVGNVMLVVPFEEVEGLIAEARAGRVK